MLHYSGYNPTNTEKCSKAVLEIKEGQGAKILAKITCELEGEKRTKYFFPKAIKEREYILGYTFS